MNRSEFSSLVFFLVGILIILFFDLGLFSKNKKTPTFRDSLIRTGFWVLLAAGFALFLWFDGASLHGIRSSKDLNAILSLYDHTILGNQNTYLVRLQIFNHNLALTFLNGYLVEYSLSMDNILVIILIFSSFNIERKSFHFVLFWGILGAILMRAIFIFLGSTLIENFHWVLYIFGGFLVISGTLMFLKRNQEENIQTETHPVVKLLSRFFPMANPVNNSPSSHRFFVKEGGRIAMTSLFVVLMIIEFTDLIFAVDSIPAVFSITQDPYIVFFSNIFAIMGLRSLFFLMENIVHRFRYLKTGLSILLIFIGVKMVFPSFFEKIGFSNIISLFIILFILGGSILISLIVENKRLVTKIPKK